MHVVHDDKLSLNVTTFVIMSFFYRQGKQVLDIYAGPTAKQTLLEQGFNKELFSTFLGASGGPKWFSLYGLDKYLFGEFFKNKQSTLDLIGSSAGAFRASCLAQQDPVKAITELAYRYSETDFTLDATPTGVTRAAQQLLTHILPPDSVQQVLDNPIMKVHFITALCNGSVASENKLKQGYGLAKSLLNNRRGRERLTHQYQRVIFSTAEQPLKFQESAVFSTEYAALSKNNIHNALLASGAIPMVMLGIKGIEGAPKGMYRDGGLIDYHFDFKVDKPGLTLYPHFNSTPKAGWFDKNLSRNANPANYDNTVMLVPSETFVNNLPFGKIPDRTDFEKIDTSTRIRYWHTVFDETERLAESFDRTVSNPNSMVIKDLPF